jgi:small conductance mechanosensitive channel
VFLRSLAPAPTPEANPSADPSDAPATPAPTSEGTPAPTAEATPAPTPEPTPEATSTPDPTDLVLPDPEALTEAVLSTCTSSNDVICPLVEGILPKGWAPFAAWLITIVLILAGAFVLRKLVLRLIERITRKAAQGVLPEKLRARSGQQTDAAQVLLTERRRQRAETMGSVLRHVATVVIMGTAFLMVLARFGMNLAPLLTSVGILGIAIGFGAQELVKDFISGMFMLLEDQYGVGDIIDAGPATGTVEAVTLRITRLRDADGRVWYIRNGTISRVGNESQGWSRALVNVPVPYDADIEEVRELLKSIANGLWEEPGMRDLVIVEEPKVYALEQISDSAMLFRVTAKTMPGKQNEVARELRVRIKHALDEKGVPFAAAS